MEKSNAILPVMAVPYAIGALGASGLGVAVACSTASTAGIITGIAIAVFGACSFFGVLNCGLANRDNSEQFHSELGRFVLTTAGNAAAKSISTIANAMLIAFATQNQNVMLHLLVGAV